MLGVLSRAHGYTKRVLKNDVYLSTRGLVEHFSQKEMQVHSFVFQCVTVDSDDGREHVFDLQVSTFYELYAFQNYDIDVLAQGDV